MRGWVEALADAVPTTDLAADGKLRTDLSTAPRSPMYKLTEAGWNVIHRMQFWVMATFIVALVTLVATIAGTLITTRNSDNGANKGFHCTVLPERQNRQ